MQISFSIPAIALIFSCAPAKKEEGKNFTSISADEAETMIHTGNDLIILDVRTPAEIQLGKIAGAVEIDLLQASFKEEIKKLNKEKTFLVYCAVGSRSNNAMQLMKQLNFNSVYNLAGGIEAWKQAGKPIVE